MGNLSGTVIKAWTVLDAVVRAPGTDGIGLSELAQAAYGRSTTHRLLQTLLHLGLVTQTAGSKYTVGPVLLQYAMAVAQSAPWINRARVVIEDLAARCDETVTLSLLLPSMERVFVYQVESPQPVRWVAGLGVRAPLYQGASGRAILAGLNEHELQRYLAKLRSAPSADPPLNDLESVVEETRARGYATSVAEYSPDGAATASALVPRAGHVVGAVSIAIPVSRSSDRLMREHGSMVVSAAREIEAVIRGTA